LLKGHCVMKTDYFARTLTLAAGLALQLSLLCFHSLGAPGDVDLSFDPGSGVNGTVSSIALQPDGKVLIGGQFTTVKGRVCRGIARLNSDGSTDPSFAGATLPGNPIVNTLALQGDGKVLVGHQYGLTRLNSDGTPDTNFNGNVWSDYSDDENVYAIALQPDGKVLVGGSFATQIGTDFPFGVARLNADGSLDTTFNPGTGASGSVSSLALQTDGTVVIGGSFTSVNGTSRSRIARLNGDGRLDTSFDPGSGANDFVRSVTLQFDGKVLIGGVFTLVNGTSRRGIARLYMNGTLDGTFDPGTGVTGTGSGFGASSIVNSLVLQSDGKVLLGGFFATVGGSNRNDIARLNPNGTLDASFQPGSGVDGPGIVASVGVGSMALQPDGRVLLGGDFRLVNGLVRSRIARLTMNGVPDLAFNVGTGVDGSVYGALQSGGKPLIAGLFSTVNELARSGMARLNADGTGDSTFTPGSGATPGPSVYSLTLQADGKVLIAGTFTQVNGTNRNRVARLNPGGSLDGSFEPGTGVAGTDFTIIKSVAVQSDGAVLVGGSFATFNGMARNSLAKLHADGTLDSSFIPATTDVDVVNCIIMQPDGRILVGGYSNRTDAEYIFKTYKLIRLNANGTLDTTFQPAMGPITQNDTYICAIALQPDGKVIVGGSAEGLGGVVRLNSDGTTDTSFAAKSVYLVFSLALQPNGKILMGGFFGAPPALRNIARLNTDGSLDSSFNCITGGHDFGDYVRSIALQSDGKILIGGDFTTVNGVVRPYVARVYGDPVAPTLSITRSNSSLVVSWSEPFGGYQLQGSTNLSLANSWSAVAQAASTNDAQIFVTVPTSASSQFFRLQSQ
jgi:uncharacterized delta-60 repeat protein